MKIEKWDDNYIWFTDGTTISYEHDADCCEFNWADFSVLEIFYQDEEFDDFEIIPVDGCGFLLSLKLPKHDKWLFSDYILTKKIFIPCYSDQNGYYSSDLTIIIRGPEGKPEYINLDCEWRDSECSAW